MWLLQQSRQFVISYMERAGSYVAGCCVALGCPSRAMTLRLCVIHSMDQTGTNIIRRLGSNGPASVYQEVRRKYWECQDLRGLMSDDLSASFHTIKGPRRQKCRSSRRGRRSPLSGLQLQGSGLHSLTQRSFPIS